MDNKRYLVEVIPFKQDDNTLYKIELDDEQSLVLTAYEMCDLQELVKDMVIVE